MSAKLRLNALIDEVIAREGEYSDHPADRGGPTRWGITQATARAHGYLGDMRKFPREFAVDIYMASYWQRPNFDGVALIYADLAQKLLDAGINMGPKTVSKFLQRVLNVLNRQAKDYPDIPTDGDIGKLTLASLRAFKAKRGAVGEVVLLRAIEALQGERYIALAEANPAQEAFVYGWIANRLGIAA